MNDDPSRRARVDVRAAFSPACLRLALAARRAACSGSRGRDPEGREEGPGAGRRRCGPVPREGVAGARAGRQFLRHHRHRGQSRDRNLREDHREPIAIARACEKILLSSGLADEAYARYSIAANQGTTFLATFRAIAKKYPTQVPSKILDDLVASTPGQDGKWFAAAKDAGLYDEAIALAQRTPCDPRTLTRAARDFAAARPRFAVEARLAALRWIAAGYGYEITDVDVLAACSSTLAAARSGGWIDETEGRIRALVAGPRSTAKDLIVALLATRTIS